MWGQTSVCGQHMTAKGVEIAAYGVANKRRHVAPQPYVTLGRATSDLLLEQTRISILSWNLGPKRGSPGTMPSASASHTQLHVSRDGFWVLVALAVFVFAASELRALCDP